MCGGHIDTPPVWGRNVSEDEGSSLGHRRGRGQCPGTVTPVSSGSEAKQDRQVGFPFPGGLGVPACIAHKDSNRVHKHSRC